MEKSPKHNFGKFQIMDSSPLQLFKESKQMLRQVKSEEDSRLLLEMREMPFQQKKKSGERTQKTRSGLEYLNRSFYQQLNFVDEITE